MRLTAEHARGKDLQRLIWMPGDGTSADERQRAFVLRVQDHRQAEPFDAHCEAGATQAREQLARGRRLADVAIDLSLDERQRR